MATTTLPHATTARGGTRSFGRQHVVNDGLALLVLLCATVVGLVAGYARAVPFEVGVAGRYNTPYLQQFHEPEIATGEQQPSYRWTQARSMVVAPGLGRGLWTTRLSLDSPAAAGSPKQVLLEAGTVGLPLQLTAQRRVIHFLTPSVGDLGISIATTTGQYGADPRPLGVAFFGIAFDPIVSSMAPPLSTLLFSLVTLALAFLTLRWSGLPAWAATVVPLFGFSVLVWGISAHRAAVGLLVPRLTLLAITGLIATVLLTWAWRALVRLGRLDPEPWLLPALLTVFYLGFWIKAAGLVYPYSHAIDVPWHMQHTREILNGRLAELYKPGAFSESVMPVKEWGEARPVIPYSPFFHIFAASFAIFPWSLEATANIFSVLIDTSRGVLIASLALAFGLRSRAAFLAALLYAVTPFTFLLHSWGNIPTTFGMWWTLLATTVIVLGYDRLSRPKVFLLVLLALLATLLFYTVMAVFMGVFVVLLLLAVLVAGRGLPRRSAGALAGAFGLAIALSLLIYYGQYIGPIVQRTLPYIGRTVVGGEQGAGQDVILPFSTYVSNYVPHIGYMRDPALPALLGWLPVPWLPANYAVEKVLWYGVALPLFVGLPGIVLLRRNRLALLVVGVWLAVALLFFVAGSRISMVDKHLFYLVPALAITTGAVLDRAWKRWRWMGLAIGIMYLGSLTSAVELWILRLQRVA